MKKVLIAYGTRYGITEEIAKEIANELETNDLISSLFNLNNKKQIDFPKIDDYDGILAGTGIKVGQWKKEVKKFLKANITVLNNNSKIFGLFISCGTLINKDLIPRAREEFIELKIKKYNINPNISDVFGSYFDLTKNSNHGLLVRKLIKTLSKRDYKVPLEDKIYEFRDWDRIRAFAKEFANLLK
ncbi:MAG: hypothetical protein KGD57_07430 [Candidatus Lokiarchaeota archaeon]|nr:hypothetical protein [Candidatus Lokiarchaeota archaeon]